MSHLKGVSVRKGKGEEKRKRGNQRKELFITRHNFNLFAIIKLNGKQIATNKGKKLGSGVKESTEGEEKEEGRNLNSVSVFGLISWGAALTIALRRDARASSTEGDYEWIEGEILTNTFSSHKEI